MINLLVIGLVYLIVFLLCGLILNITLDISLERQFNGKKHNTFFWTSITIVFIILLPMFVVYSFGYLIYRIFKK